MYSDRISTKKILRDCSNEKEGDSYDTKGGSPFELHLSDEGEVFEVIVEDGKIVLEPKL